MFKHVRRSTNDVAYFLAEIGVDRREALVDFGVVYLCFVVAGLFFGVKGSHSGFFLGCTDSLYHLYLYFLFN